MYHTNLFFVKAYEKSSNKPDFRRAGRKAIYSVTDTIVEVTALMVVEATFHASVNSAAGLPRINNL